jgi:hypothetical protein
MIQTHTVHDLIFNIVQIVAFRSTALNVARLLIGGFLSISITTDFLASSHVAVRNPHSFFFTNQQDNFEVNLSAVLLAFSEVSAHRSVSTHVDSYQLAHSSSKLFLLTQI